MGSQPPRPVSFELFGACQLFQHFSQHAFLGFPWQLFLGALVFSYSSASAHTVGYMHEPTKEGRMVRYLPHPNVMGLALYMDC
jgi:hypothetical protein